MTENQNTFSIYDIMDVPREYFTISKPKQEISKAIQDARKEDLSLRKMAKELKELYSSEAKTPHYNTLQQITSGGNYTIDNLLMLLDLLNKKIVIMDRTPEDISFIENKGKK